MKRINRTRCVAVGCGAVLLALGSFTYLQIENADFENGMGAAAYASVDPTGCTENCLMIDRSRAGIAVLNNFPVH